MPTVDLTLDKFFLKTPGYGGLLLSASQGTPVPGIPIRFIDEKAVKKSIYTLVATMLLCVGGAASGTPSENPWHL